jgi:LuxR family maltose regulon positive regulatory protein
MDEALLQTKLYIPTTRSDAAPGLQSSLVNRPRLLERINEGLSGKLTLISAPAGFGKTTLVSDWLNHIKRPAAWLSLDEDDNEFARFWTYVIAALVVRLRSNLT